MTPKKLASLYKEAHNKMRNIDGLQPQESFDELLKFLFLKESNEFASGESLAASLALNDEGRYITSPSNLAKQARDLFTAYINNAPESIRLIWPDAKIKLSDECLAQVVSIFDSVTLTNLDLDVRSTALREFVPPEIRKGLGIYLTPDEIVRAMVEIVQPKIGQRVLDPACGAGTFLLEVSRLWGETPVAYKLFGVDKNPRMLALADLNLGHAKSFGFEGLLQDSLFDIGRDATENWFNSFDYIFTNPPFGVYIDPEKKGTTSFITCSDPDGHPYTRQQSEVVFIEQCFRLLKPGGKLAIVLPRSVVTNHSDRIDSARRYFGTQGCIEGIMTLPPETFSLTGAQTNTVVLFGRKYAEPSEANSTSKIWISEITNCGYDSTGRHRAGSQLLNISKEVQSLLLGGNETKTCRWLASVKNIDSFSAMPSLLASKNSSGTDGVPLSELAELINTGRTPGRSSYTDEGLFLVKVGNLSGKGIDWAARERNFIPVLERQKRSKAGLMLRVGDILMTSSAHNPTYIAKKIDVISEIPEWVGGEASFVGELMLVRVNEALIDPYVLLAYLRTPSVISQIQGMVRGQTAHLHSKDLSQLKIPKSLLEGNPQAEKVAEMLKEEARLARASNHLQWVLDKNLAELDII